MKPLPLIDGCLFIDNTTLEYLSTCPRSLEYFFLNRRKLAEERSALFFGGAIHKALEHRYKQCGDSMPSAVCEQEQMKLLEEEFAAKPEVHDDFRTLGKAKELIKEYNCQYLEEPFEVLYAPDGSPMVELPFAFKLCQILPAHTDAFIDVYYTGKIDLVTKWDKTLMHIDHKTTSMMGTGFGEEQAMSAQQEGYSWALWRLTGEYPSGYCVNAIRTRAPSKTRPVADDTDFQRFKRYLTPSEIHEWESNTIALIEEMLWHYGRQYFPQKRKWCVGKYGRCPYYEVCSLPIESRELMLSSNLFAESDWSPLHKVEVKQ